MRFLSESYLWILHCCIAAYIQIWLNRFGVSALNDNLLWFFKLDSYVSWIRNAILQWFIKFGVYTFYGYKTQFHVIVIFVFLLIHFTHLMNMCYIFMRLINMKRYLGVISSASISKHCFPLRWSNISSNIEIQSVPSNK